MSARRQSLKLAADLWRAQRNDIYQLALALIVPRTGRRAKLDCDRQRSGSTTVPCARVLTAGGKLREFGVVLFAVARSKRRTRLVEALR